MSNNEQKPAPKTFVQTLTGDGNPLDDWQQITGEEVAIVIDMTRRNELSGGTPVVREFERRWREWIGTKYSLTTMNGTSALYSAYFGLGVGPGDEVICPANTWICTIAPAVFLGARPVFCDIDPETLLMDPEDVRRKITPSTACIVAVHLWGLVCDMDAILSIARAHNIPVLEDCSHAHGARYKGRLCGSLGAVGCWSLQGSKAVSAGEGGVLATDEVEVFERACLAGQVNRISGVDLVTERYAQYQPLGLGNKFRAHPLGIGLASVQLRRLEETNNLRRDFFQAVESGLDQIPGLRPVKHIANTERGGYYGFPILHDPDAMAGVATESYVAALREAGLSAELTPYPNLHELPLFAKGFDLWTRNRGPLCPEHGYKGYKPEDLPGAYLAARRTIFLPRLTKPKPGAVEYILETLRITAEKLQATSTA